MATIENVNDRTILQQFHSLYKAVEEIKNKGINLNVKGQYESTTTYLQGDVVYNNGKAFYRINDGATTGIDTTNAEYWQMFFDAVTGLTGPQGPQGPQGPKGENGVGFNDATIIKVINDAITVDNTGINLEQTTEVTTQSNGTFEINTQSKLPITGSDTVVVDLAEDGTHANIHLDADIKNKLDKALITPTSTPTATEIVAVDNTNSQTMLAIGDGLSVENGTLKASGGSGGNAVTLGTETQTFDGAKRLNITNLEFSENSESSNRKSIKLDINSKNNKLLELKTSNASYITFQVGVSPKNKILNRYGAVEYILSLPYKTGEIALLTDIDAKVPDAPSTDGTYTLKCVVSNNGTTKTYQWILDN